MSIRRQGPYQRAQRHGTHQFVLGMWVLLIGSQAGVGQEPQKKWQVELDRMQHKISEGEYESALEIAKLFEQEFSDKKKKLNVPQLRSSAMVIRHAEVLALIARGACEKHCGHESAARSRLLQAEKQLQENRLVIGSQYDFLLSLYVQSKANEEWAEVIGDHPTGRIERWRQQKIRPVLDTMGSSVYLTEQAQLLVLDGLATLHIDDAIPFGPDSARVLGKAEQYFDKAQVIRERDFHGVSRTFTIHGDQQATFLRNYGRLFLKQAELKFVRPEAPVRLSLTVLIERADDYLNRSLVKFGEWQQIIDEMQKLVHEGSLTKANQAMRLKLAESNLKGRELDEFMEDLKTICLGYADLCFNISELRQLQARVAASTPDTAAVQEKLDEAEQLILNAVDMLGLITPKQDHPTLVIGYAETASIGALRVQLLNESPREDLFDYIDMAKTVMTTRRLNDSTVQGKYLVKAEALCEAARAGRK